MTGDAVGFLGVCFFPESPSLAGDAVVFLAVCFFPESPSVVGDAVAFMGACFFVDPVSGDVQAASSLPEVAFRKGGLALQPYDSVPFSFSHLA